MSFKYKRFSVLSINREYIYTNLPFLCMIIVLSLSLSSFTLHLYYSNGSYFRDDIDHDHIPAFNIASSCAYILKYGMLHDNSNNIIYNNVRRRMHRNKEIMSETLKIFFIFFGRKVTFKSIILL